MRSHIYSPLSTKLATISKLLLLPPKHEPVPYSPKSTRKCSGMVHSLVFCIKEEKVKLSERVFLSTISANIFPFSQLEIKLISITFYLPQAYQYNTNANS